MKNLTKALITLNLVIWSVVGVEVAQAAEKQKVCIEVKDAKTGKVSQQCKEMKVHKKLEGTKVPEKK